MDASAVIRPIAEAEIERLEETYPEPGAPVSRHRVRSDLQDRGEGMYLVAWQGKHPVGWIFVHRPGSPEASAHARQLSATEIEDLQVAPSFQVRGMALPSSRRPNTWLMTRAGA